MLYIAYKVGNVYFIPQAIKGLVQPLLDDISDFIGSYPYIRFEFQLDEADVISAESITCNLYLYPTPRSYNHVLLSDIKAQQPLVTVSSVLAIADSLVRYNTPSRNVAADILLLLLSDFNQDKNVYIVSDSNKAVLPIIDGDDVNSVSLVTNQTKIKTTKAEVAPVTVVKGYMLMELLAGHLEGLTSLKLPDVTVSLNYSFDNLLYVDEAGVINSRQYQSHTTYDELLHLPTKEIIIQYDNQGVVVVKQYVIDSTYEAGSDERVVHTVTTDYLTDKTTSDWKVQKIG